MPKLAKEMTALDVKRAKHPGGHDRNITMAVGGVAGLLLQITPGGAKSWILRSVVGEKRRSLGLGSYPEVSLADARDGARRAKSMIREGTDPIEERKAARAALAAQQRRGLTFNEALDRYFAEKSHEFRSEKHRKQWRAGVESMVCGEIGNMLVSEIGTQDVLRALHPHWLTTTDTARRVRGRVENVLSWATVAGHRTGENPARWRGNLDQLLPKPSRVAKKGNWPALSQADAPAWFADLRGRDGMAARALEFLVQTAARSGEVRGAVWGEIDLDAGLWIVPAERMKMEREHRVPLPASAVALLRSLPRFAGTDLVFPGPRGGPMSDMTISAVMRRMHDSEVKAGRPGWLDPRSGQPCVPHGMRSLFKDWAAERGFPNELSEIALAHKVGSEVERAYRRSDLVERRRQMMEAWSRFLRGEERGNVVSLAGAAL